MTTMELILAHIFGSETCRKLILVSIPIVYGQGNMIITLFASIITDTLRCTASLNVKKLMSDFSFFYIRHMFI